MRDRQGEYRFTVKANQPRLMREDASRVRSGAAPQALAALPNTILRLVRSLPGPLTAIRETFAENRLSAISLAKNGFLWMTLSWRPTRIVAEEPMGQTVHSWWVVNSAQGPACRSNRWTPKTGGAR